MRVKLPRVGMSVLVAAAVAALPLAAQAPTVTVGGVGYAQYVYQIKDTANHLNNFDVTRAYINVLGSFPAGVKTRVTGDIYHNTVDGSLTYRLKYAYAAWTPEKSALTFKFGQLHTPFLDWEENLWDYRMQGQMAWERAGYLSSSDFGAGIDGMWGFERVNMQIGIFNGENYNKPVAGDKQKDVMGRLSVRLLGTDQAGRTGGLRLTGYGQVGKPTGGGRRNRFIGMLSWRSKVLTLAAEYGATKDTATAPVAGTKKGRVISAFGVLRVPKTKVELIGRFDSTDPNTASTVINDRISRVIAGLAYNVGPNLRVLADIDNASYQGGVTTPALEAVRSQALFQIQFTF